MKQAPPLVASQLRRLVIDMRRRVAASQTAAERFAMVRDVPIFLRGIPHDEARARTVVSGRGTSAADIRGRGVHFQFPLWENSTGILPIDSGEEDCRLSRIMRGGRYDRVPTGRRVHAVGPNRGLGFFCSRASEKTERKGNLALTPAQVTANLRAHLRAAGMKDKRYTLHFFRVGGAASHHMVGATMDVLMEYVGWKSAAVAGRYAGATASASGSRGAKRSRDAAFIDADTLPLSGGCGDSYATFPRDNRGQSIRSGTQLEVRG